MLRTIGFAVRLTKKVAPMIQTNANGNGNAQLEVYKLANCDEMRRCSLPREPSLRDEFIWICTKMAFEAVHIPESQIDDNDEEESLQTILNDLVDEAQSSEEEKKVDALLKYLPSLWLGMVRFARDNRLTTFYRNKGSGKSALTVRKLLKKVSRLLDAFCSEY